MAFLAGNGEALGLLLGRQRNDSLKHHFRMNIQQKSKGKNTLLKSEMLVQI